MAVRDPYSVHPRLARYAAGWDRYAAIAGNEDAELWRGYCEYVGEHDSWDGEPLRFDDWLASQQQYAARHDATTGQLCEAAALLAATFGTSDAETVLRAAYDAYASVVAAPLSYPAWRAALVQAAGQHTVPCVQLAARPACCSFVRPHLRVLR